MCESHSRKYPYSATGRESRRGGPWHMHFLAVLMQCKNGEMQRRSTHARPFPTRVVTRTTSLFALPRSPLGSLTECVRQRVNPEKSVQDENHRAHVLIESSWMRDILHILTFFFRSSFETRCNLLWTYLVMARVNRSNDGINLSALQAQILLSVRCRELRRIHRQCHLWSSREAEEKMDKIWLLVFLLVFSLIKVS